LEERWEISSAALFSFNLGPGLSANIVVPRENLHAISLRDFSKRRIIPALGVF
jgi:hypothetical protein